MCMAKLRARSGLTCKPKDLLPTFEQLRAGMKPFGAGEPVKKDAGRQAAFKVGKLQSDDWTDDWQELDRLITITLEQPTSDPVGVRVHCYCVVLSTVGYKQDYFDWWYKFSDAAIELFRDQKLWGLYAHAVRLRLDRERDVLLRKTALASLNPSIGGYPLEDYCCEMEEIASRGKEALKAAEKDTGEIYRGLAAVYKDLLYQQKFTRYQQRYDDYSQQQGEM